MHAKEATIQTSQTQYNELKDIKATCEPNEKSKRITNIREQQIMFAKSDQIKY